MSWGGVPGTTLNMFSKTEGTGKSALQPYGPRGSKRIGEVRLGKGHKYERISSQAYKFMSFIFSYV